MWTEVKGQTAINHGLRIKWPRRGGADERNPACFEVIKKNHVVSVFYYREART